MTAGTPLAKSALQSPMIAHVFDQAVGSPTRDGVLINAAGAAQSVITFAGSQSERRGSEMRGIMRGRGEENFNALQSDIGHHGRGAECGGTVFRVDRVRG
jgi:hypothetical protein